MTIKRLDKEIKVAWRISGHLFAVILSFLFSVSMFFGTRNVVLSLIPFVVIIPFTEWMIRLSFKNYGYELIKDSLKIEKGVITKTYKSIPYSRIQNVDIRRGVLARILGYSSVMIHTAGYSGAAQNYMPEGYLPGVSVEEAEKIREFILKKIK